MCDLRLEDVSEICLVEIYKQGFLGSEKLNKL